MADPLDSLAARVLERGWIDLEPGPPGPSRGRYRAIGVIAEGGMGRVVRARDTELDRDVAVKYVRPWAAEAELIDRLAGEAKILAQMEHPNIVRTYDIGRDAAGDLFFVMQLVEGRSLDGQIADGSPVRRLQMFLDVCRAVSYAHGRGVIHRDLKPGNIMIGARGEVYVTDWGLAKLRGVGGPWRAAEAAAAGSATQGGWGTPGYAAPEQIAGAPDERSDIFSLGKVLAEWITPAPREIAAIAKRATEYDPARRYATVDALAADVQAYLDDRPGAAWRDRPWERLLKWAKRHPVTAVLAVVVAVVAVLWSTRERELMRSRESIEATGQADQALTEWRVERYMPPHDVTPARQKLERARERLSRALEIEPNAHAVRARLGWVLLQLGRTGESRVELERAAAGGEPCHWWLAQAYVELELPTDDAMRAAAVNASPMERELARAFVAVREGRREEGLAALESIAARYPQGGEEALFVLGTVVPEWDRRVEYLGRAVRMAPSWAKAHAYAALAGASHGARLQETGGAPEATYAWAVEQGDAAVLIDPGLFAGWAGRAGARMNWGSFLILTGRDPSALLSGAIDDMTRAIQIDGTRAAAWADRGDAKANLAMHRGSAELYRAAIEDYDEALRRDPSDLESQVSRAGARAQLGGYAEAVAELEAVLSADDRRVRAWLTLGVVLFAERRDFERSESAFTKVIELDAGMPDGWWRRGLARLELGRNAEALADFERAIGLDPSLRGMLEPHMRRAQEEF